jgi:hypothetical protein
MGNAQTSCCFTSAWKKESDKAKQQPAELYNIPCLDGKGKPTNLNEFLANNKCMLIANVASE